MKTRLINKERIVESLDATLRDLEIRACWLGLKASELSYQENLKDLEICPKCAKREHGAKNKKPLPE